MDMGSGTEAVVSQTHRRVGRGASVFQWDSQGDGNAGNACGLNLPVKSSKTSYLVDLILSPRIIMYAATSSVRDVEMRGGGRMNTKTKTKIGLVRFRTIGNAGMHDTIFCSCLWFNCSVQAHDSPGYVQDPDKTSKNEKQKSFHLALAMPQFGGRLNPNNRTIKWSGIEQNASSTLGELRFPQRDRCIAFLLYIIHHLYSALAFRNASRSNLGSSKFVITMKFWSELGLLEMRRLRMSLHLSGIHNPGDLNVRPLVCVLVSCWGWVFFLYSALACSIRRSFRAYSCSISARLVTELREDWW